MSHTFKNPSRGNQMSQQEHSESEIFAPVKGKSVFKKRACHWYRKNQIVPNALFYNAELSDSAVRLLCALNALPESWIIIQSDIRERLGWGRDKMRNAIKECENAGYMQVQRCRGDDGMFSISNYEYDLEPVYLKEFPPRTENPHPDVSRAENHPLPCSLGNIPCSKEQQTEEPSAVVVSSDSDKEEEQDWMWLINMVPNVDYRVLENWHSLCPDRDRLKKLIYYAFRQGSEVDNPIGWITSAIKGNWVIPDITQKERLNLGNFNRLKAKFPDQLKYWIQDGHSITHQYSGVRIFLDQDPQSFERKLNSEVANG